MFARIMTIAVVGALIAPGAVAGQKTVVIRTPPMVPGGDRHWERFAAEVGLPPEEVLGICESVADETPDRFADIVRRARSEGLDHPVVDRLEEAVAKQAGACLDRLRG